MFKIHSYSNLLMALLLVLPLMSCANDVANRYYAAEKYPPKKAEDVEILTSKPARKFIVLADFQSRGESNDSYAKRAAAIGADAIIVTSLGGYYSLNEEDAGKDRYKDKYHSRRVATVIKYQ